MNSMGGSVGLPGVDDFQAVYAFEIFGFAGDKRQVGSQGNGGYLGVCHV
jgi:hypothetical protein